MSILKRINLCCLVLALPLLSLQAQTIPLALDVATANQLSVTESPTGTYVLSSTGADPKIRSVQLPAASYDPDQVYVISFDYVAADGLDGLQIYYGTPIAGARSVTFGSLSATTSYRTFKAFMKIEAATWDEAYRDFRFDFGNSSGQEITLRNLQLRAPTATEVISLRLDPANVSPFITVTEPTANNYDITTSGGDPWVGTETITTVYNPDSVYVLSFDYTSTSGLNDLRIFYGEPNPARAIDYGRLPAAATRTNFKSLLNVDAVGKWTEFFETFRFDFGTTAGLDIQVSNLVLREPTNAERKLAPVLVETVSVELNTALTSGNLNATEDAPGSYTLTTTGPDPWIRSKQITERYDTDSTYILEFEYQASAEYNELQIFYGLPPNGVRSFTTLPVAAAATWTTYTINTRLESDNFADSDWTDFRFDFGRRESTTDEKTFLIRNITLRKPTAAEVVAEEDSDKLRSRRNNAEFLAYLAADYPDSVAAVDVTMEEVTIGGTVGADAGARFLVEILPEQYGFNLDTFITALSLTPVGGAYEQTLDRYVALIENGISRQRDRLYSRWAVATPLGNDRYELASLMRWPTGIVKIANNNQPEDKQNALKGLEGLKNDNTDMFFDLEDLDVKAHRIGLLLHGLYRRDTTGMTFRFNNKTYGVSPNFINGLDERVKLLTDASMKTSLTILCPLNNVPAFISDIFTHPDARTGLYSMANVTSAEGVEYYTAYVDFLAKRYSRPDSLYGRVTQFIIHNEVDAHTEWTHAGEKPVDLYVQIYDRSMRLVYLTARKHNPTFKVFTSHTKHFNSKPGSNENFRGLDILNRLTDLSKKEGDYEWGIAWHSYPTNLTDPRVWNDPIPRTRLDFLTPEITPRNIEVIDAFVRQKDRLYNGKKVRTIMLSENGFNSNPALAGGSETNQAAAVAYFWKKAENKRLPAIETIHLQRWVDFPTEQGILFGLWTTAPGTRGEFDTKKLSWQVWADAGTANESGTFDPYKTTIGIAEWSEIQFNFASETTPYPVTMEISCYDPTMETMVSFNGERRMPQPNGSVNFYNVASNVDQAYEVFVDGNLAAKEQVSVTGPTDVAVDLCSLPVEWQTFTAEALTKTARLIWSVSPEKENAGFTVQRSATGLAFATISEVAARPVMEPQNYEVTDPNPLRGTSYYRIVQTDFDGQAVTSPVRRIDFGELTQELSISPNPSSGIVTLRLPGNFVAEQLQLIDATGRVTEVDLPGESGQLALGNVPEGAYVLRAIARDGTVVSGKLVLR
ncbi:DUF5722 domain-containing protein [Neolewinella antarctica]|uniref:DUF5722 domain-containing protein n=1 Tax=Neolewinella antarctica TaxID=442734 RepID=A0ABX0XB03_9BACT|nr:DUF5722 domain-containing protein [Neolewinella antarctica]NJC26441.1 hypothetical protein [Neolewinella antarctica]